MLGTNSVYGIKIPIGGVSALVTKRALFLVTAAAAIESGVRLARFTIARVVRTVRKAL